MTVSTPINQIRKWILTLLLRYHPDKLKDHEKRIESLLEFAKLLVQANSVLFNQERKANYDTFYKNSVKNKCSICSKKNDESECLLVFSSRNYCSRFKRVFPRSNESEVALWIKTRDDKEVYD